MYINCINDYSQIVIDVVNSMLENFVCIGIYQCDLQSTLILIYTNDGTVVVYTIELLIVVVV